MVSYHIPTNKLLRPVSKISKLYPENNPNDSSTRFQFSEEGDKYSGGLGTYTAKHVPMAIYVPEVEKIFLVYGGAKERQDIYWRWPPITITHTA